MRKIFVSFLIVGMISFPLLARPQQQPKGKPVLSDLIQEALDNNPRLEAAIQRVLSAERAIPQAGALPDPKITLGLMNLPMNSFTFDQEPMTGKQIALMQMFPFPGKQALSTDMVEFEATAVRHQKEDLRNQIIQMVKLAYYDLYAVDRAIETVQRNKDLMEQLVRVVEIKYATGSGLQQDVLRSQVELSKLEDDLIMWKQKRLTIAAKLNGILNRPANSPYDTTPQGLDPPTQLDLALSADDVEQQRPLLRAWREKIQKVETAIKLARRDRWPNITVGASYNQRDDLETGAKMHDFFSASVTLDIPLYAKRKQNQKIVQRQIEMKATEAEYQNILNEVLSEIESLKAVLERNRKRVELYEGGILLQAQQSLESAQAGYQVGKVDFLTVVDNWMRLLSYELQYHFALADYHKALANYDFATGAKSSWKEMTTE